MQLVSLPPPPILQSEFTVMIEEHHCIVPDNLTVSASWWTYGVANCTVPPVTAGRVNVSITVVDSSNGFGDTQPSQLIAYNNGGVGACQEGECMIELLKTTGGNA